MNKITKERIKFNIPSVVSVTDLDTPEVFPPHWHNAAEFIAATGDGCKYRINDVIYDLSAGDVLLVWPQQIHETIWTPQGSVVFIQFSSVILENNLDLVSISRFLYAFHHISSNDEPALSAMVTQKILEIQKIRHSQDPLAETRCKICIYDALLEIGEYVMSRNQKECIPEKSSDTGWGYIHAACNYILEKSSENLTQAEVARQVGLSTFYFSRLFRQYMHVSFPAYLSNIRVKNAAKLLLKEDLSITECAFLAGFQSTTAFNKTFHDVTGYSPRDFRKLYR